MNEYVYAGKCVTPGCKAPGESSADSYTLVKLGVVGRRGKVCQGCLKGVEVGKGQLLSGLGGGEARRLLLGEEAWKLEAGGDARTELDEAPEMLTVEDSEDEEGGEVAEEGGEDIVEVYGGDWQVEEVVRKVATKMGFQRRMGQEERNIGTRVERLQGKVEETQGLFRHLEREMEDIQQLLYSEVLFIMSDTPWFHHSFQVNTGGTIRLPELQLGDCDSNSRERLRVDSSENRSSPGTREVPEVGDRCLLR